MRQRSPWLLFAASLPALVAGPAGAVLIDAVIVGDPGNAADVAPNCVEANCGSVADVYAIGAYEVTNAQYAELLNAVADSDPNNLYNPSMSSDARGGITRGGSPGSYSYAVKAGRANNPVVFVSFYDALRFANWLHNGEPNGAQGAGTTEDGAYTITPAGISNNSITRNPGALAWLPSESEWFKAAYYDPDLGIYYEYPAGSDGVPVHEAPPGGANSANYWSGTYALTGSGSFDNNFNYLADVGSYAGSASPVGTFDQGGNVWEWNEVVTNGNERGVRGGGWDDQNAYLSASIPAGDPPTNEAYDVGFRVAPEPGADGLAVAAAAALSLAAARSRRRG